mmetsp:Transcript_5920/g.14397  ORF Transcript_5920/g.14397 Transcript_5920/m.14397 type:complete len:94 (-) Transcript_5920:379-660(-)
MLRATYSRVTQNSTLQKLLEEKKTRAPPSKLLLSLSREEKLRTARNENKKDLASPSYESQKWVCFKHSFRQLTLASQCILRHAGAASLRKRLD